MKDEIKSKIKWFGAFVVVSMTVVALALIGQKVWHAIPTPPEKVSPAVDAATNVPPEILEPIPPEVVEESAPVPTPKPRVKKIQPRQPKIPESDSEPEIRDRVKTLEDSTIRFDGGNHKYEKRGGR